MSSYSRPTSASTTLTQSSRAPTSEHHQTAPRGGGNNVVLHSSKGDPYARGGIQFSGPDNLRHYNRSTVTDASYGGQYIGEGLRSRENTSQITYMFRAPPGVPFPKAKNGRIGETGWEIEFFQLNR